MSNDTQAFATASRESLRSRFWRRLGFGFRSDTGLFDWRNEEPKDGDWWVIGAISTTTVVHVSFLDRLRLLVSGRAYLEESTRTNVEVERAETRSAFCVLPPGAVR